MGGRTEPSRVSLAPCGVICSSSSSDRTSLPGRLQKEVRLAQKADYSAQRAASPLPCDKISVGLPAPSSWGV